MEHKVIRGWIDNDSYGVWVIKEQNKDYSGDSIAGIFEEFDGKRIAVHYYIAPDEMTEEQAIESSVRKDLGGEVDAEYILDAYSSWTVLQLEEKAVVGGHDLMEELLSYEGKYIILIIEVQESPNE